MNFISKFSKIIPLLFFVFVLVGCSDDDDGGGTTQQMDPTIVELAQSSNDLTSLVAALGAADGDLVNVLSSGNFTVLAPTNAAFDAFLAANGFASLDDVPTDLLSQVLLNHVITGSVTSTDLTTAGSGYASTNADGFEGNKLSLYYDTSAGVRFNDTANVVTPDLNASNGVVHVIDAVIGLPDIVDHASYNPNFSNLVAALGAADGGLVNVLQGAGPFTVLAPDNAAFGTFLNGAALGDVATDVLANILLNHVLTGGTLSTDLTAAGAGYTSTNGTNGDGDALSLYFNTSSGVVFNGISTVTQADVITTNGVIHAVDTVIDIPTVVTFAVADPTFSTLVSALTELTPATDFVSTLSTADGTDPAPFTVFAPTNDAFDALDAIPAEDVLTVVLQHHVAAGANIRSGDLTDGIMADMLNGDMITINLPGTGDNIADVTDGAGNSDIGIIAVDVQAGNGVIHVLNKVMLPSDD